MTQPHSLPSSLIDPVSVAPFVNLQESGSAERVAERRRDRKVWPKGQTAGLLSELISAE